MLTSPLKGDEAQITRCHIIIQGWRVLGIRSYRQSETKDINTENT